jgi:hypothetical protein
MCNVEICEINVGMYHLAASVVILKCYVTTEPSGMTMLQIQRCNGVNHAASHAIRDLEG